MTHQIEFKGLIIDVQGTYYKGQFGTFETPPEPEEFEIDKVELLGTDITELMEEHINDLEVLTIQNHYR